MTDKSSKAHKRHDIALRTGVLHLGATPVVMGIVNATPDSFSDGGDNFSPGRALEAATDMIAKGAGLIDLGGESTRPGSDPVTVQEELDRVMPVLDRFAEAKLLAPVSIDTRRALVAEQALQAGAAIINDVEGLQGDPDMAHVAVAHGSPVIVMHWDRDRDVSKDVMAEMTRYFERSLAIASDAGLERDRLILDPGFGFAKTLEENYTILDRLGELRSFDLPILAGTSRKSMIGKVLGNAPKERVAGTVATSVLAYERGAHIFRVHDVSENLDALRVAAACLYAPKQTAP